MSRGEIIMEDNQVKPNAVSAPGDWAAEYQQQFNGGHAWADQFAHEASIKIGKCSRCTYQQIENSDGHAKISTSLALNVLFIIS